jgi:hypothetical protein
MAIVAKLMEVAGGRPVDAVGKKLAEQTINIAEITRDAKLVLSLCIWNCRDNEEQLNANKQSTTYPVIDIDGSAASGLCNK